MKPRPQHPIYWSRASDRFPLMGEDRVAEWKKRRWDQEIALRAAVQEFRKTAYVAAGMKEHHTFKDLGMSYDAEACAVLTEIVRASPEPAAIWRAVSANVLLCRWIASMGLSLDAQGVQLALRSDQYEAYRRDREFCECINAQERAYHNLPETMASAMVREHRYWEARRRLLNVGEHHNRAVAALTDDSDVDEHDLARAMAEVERE